ncbi:hypothetical protein SRHO_G00222720 [Serrasalmus rhombeus]|uniref:protein ripply3 n=1 Tax=Pygocentrus nattereri TaxID=42514 RepID=UPI0008147289|nr:protein ripply3 [Pygocentrus nattereri]
MLPHGTTSPGLSNANANANTQGRARALGELSGFPEMWRPWTLTGRDPQPEKTVTGPNRQASKDMQGFHHPVRLFLPRSKIQEYLSHLGRKVLASFPVQATLHFYNDDSSSEEDDDDEF